MVTTFSPPLSGAVLDVVVDALDLRCWDLSEVLSQRNSRRYFSGERVSPEARDAAQRAIAEAAVRSELVPETLSFADLFPVAPAEAPAVPAAAIVQVAIAQYAERWDALSGALPRLTAPVAFPRHAAGACLRLVAIDLAIRITALLWLTREHADDPVGDFWAHPKGICRWLRSLLKATGMTRDAFATVVRVPPNTLDGWLDDEVKPSFENMCDLASGLAGQGVGDRVDLLRKLRLAFAARDLFRRIESIVGTPQALGICQRVPHYANDMLRFPRHSQQPPDENDMKMRIALTSGTLGAERMSAKWIESMLRHLWRREHNPVWRTSLRAVTGSWFEHLQDITAKLGPFDKARLANELGYTPTDEHIDAMAFRMQASSEERAREPGMAEVMLSELAEGGEPAAVELKLHAAEAIARGDRLAAIELLRAAVAEDPMNAEIHYRLGCSLWQVGDLAPGCMELEIAAQLEPTWDRPRVELAIVLLNEGRDDEALAKLVNARAKLSSPTPWLLLHLAYAHERLGQVQDAIAAYEELVTLEPDHAEALDRVAHLYFVAGAKRKGADRAKKAAHLGIPTVFQARENGFYDKSVPSERPAHDERLGMILQFPDSAWTMRRRR